MYSVEAQPGVAVPDRLFGAIEVAGEADQDA
jgi:hypothetical protein